MPAEEDRMTRKYPSWHLTEMTPEAAMRHTRRVHDIPDHVGLGWTPYNLLATHGAVSQWACYTHDELTERLKRHGLKIEGWSPWSDGVRSTFLTEDRKVCPNCEQWQHASNGDCSNECVRRGFAPRHA
jgi:hypothetical protein